MLHPRGIMMMLERCRLTSWFHDSAPFMSMNKLDMMIYMVTASLHIDNKVYNTSLEKQPVTVEQELGYLGNSSFKLKTNIVFPGHPQALIQGQQMYVLVDKLTKRPARPPTWWSDQLKPSVDPSGTPFKFPSTQMPDAVRVSQIVVNPSDTDFYLHAGSANYVKFVTDAYTAWHVREFGFEGHGDPFRAVKTMVQSFKGEAALGDVLSVKFWPSDHNQDLFHFHLIKNQQVIHECDVEFYPLDTNYLTASL